jgi:GrpB-like predicted nucleotidyltransferase (UPF0157 family)
MNTPSDITTLITGDDADVEFLAIRPQKPLEIVDYNPEWPARYGVIEKRIREALGDRVVLIQHVGSTSVPGLAAKDIIDVDLVVADPTAEEAYVPDLQAAGFQFQFREPKWYQHRFFHFEEPYTNLHVFGPDSAEVVRHQMFRDWLREHPDDCARYVEAKRGAAEATTAADEKTQQYNERKEPVVLEILNHMFKAHGLLDAE